MKLLDPKRFRLHPLGFFFNSQQIAETVTVRLHVYPTDAQFASESDWHTHEFHLHSTVLKGTLKNELGHFFPSASGALDEFSVSYSDGKSELRKTGRNGLIRITADFDTQKMGRYFLEAGVLHRAYATETPCVSLVAAVHQNAQILSYGNEEEVFERRIVDTMEADLISTELETIQTIEEIVASYISEHSG